MSTALLVIDVQKAYTSPDSELHCKDAKATVKRINRLIEYFAAKKAPIYFIRHIYKADASDLGRMYDFSGEPEEDFNFKEGTDEVQYDERLSRPQGAIELIKNRYSAFTGTDLDEHLSKQKVDRVVVCGFMTNFCCESTARTAHDNDYFVDLIIDATGTPGTETMDEKKIRETVAEFLAAGFARVMSTQQYLKALQSGAHQSRK